MLTPTELLSIVDNCSFPNWNINLRQDGTRFYVQIEDLNGVDNVTGAPLPWTSRKWFVSPHMCVSEVVRTCYKAVQNAMEHELDEQFKYKQVAIFDPHRNIDLLLDISTANNTLDTRASHTTAI